MIKGAPQPGRRAKCSPPTSTFFSGFLAKMVNWEGTESMAFITCSSSKKSNYSAQKNYCKLHFLLDRVFR
jgi:hypothetical protein